MSRTIKPIRRHIHTTNVIRHSHRYSHRPKPKVQTMIEVTMLQCGKIPTHSIRHGAHCPCCMLGDWGRTLKQRTNRALRRRVRRFIITEIMED